VLQQADTGMLVQRLEMALVVHTLATAQKLAQGNGSFSTP
jgi:hypothetical protein